MDSPLAMDSIPVFSPEQHVLHRGRRATFLHMSRGGAIIRYWGESHAVAVSPDDLSRPRAKLRSPHFPAQDEPTKRELATQERPAA
jgi:hypothetical protein